MSPDPDDPDDPGGTAPRRRWPSWVGWPVLAGAGLVAYELTAQPALVGLTLSLKFGLQDARTALWLRRRDPDRRRGAAHLWLYLSQAAWKTALAGFVLGFGFVFLFEAIGPGGGPPKGLGLQLFAGAILAGLGGLLMSAGLAAVAVGKSWWHRRPLWLNSQVAAARVRGEWPPWYGDRNHAGRLVLAGCLLVLFALGLAAVFAAGAAGVWGKPLLIGFTVYVTAGLPLAGLLLRDFLLPRVAAARPWDAWPPEPHPDGPAADRVD